MISSTTSDEQQRAVDASALRGDAETQPDQSMLRAGFLRSGVKAALGIAAVPAFLRMFEDAARADNSYAQPVVDSLNLLLSFEYLTERFYEQAVDIPGLIPESDSNGFNSIRKHESGHVRAVRGLLGGLAFPEPGLDFSGGGQFNPFSSYGSFLALSQTFEDYAVRAYKGQLPVFLGYPDTMTVILEIHSTEARHSAHVRLLRGLSAFVAGATPSEEAFDTAVSSAELAAFLAPFVS